MSIIVNLINPVYIKDLIANDLHKLRKYTAYTDIKWWEGILNFLNPHSNITENRPRTNPENTISLQTPLDPHMLP